VKAKPPAKLENVNDEPNVAQSPLPRSGSVQHITGANAGYDGQFSLRVSGWRESPTAWLSSWTLDHSA